jgi:type IV secretory pathway VirJ component
MAGSSAMRSTPMSRHVPRALVVVAAVCFASAAQAWGQSRETVTLRGHAQELHLYGNPQGDPVVVSSGDGGWIHLAPAVAEFLAERGFFVVGFDVKAYLSSFTDDHATLHAQDDPGDYRLLAAFAAKATGKQPILMGVSEGAALSVLAAADPATKRDIAGVIALGLPDSSELGWRWRDMTIYVTHGVPHEPTFSTAAIVDRVAPLPLAAIHATHDEFVPLTEVERVMKAAREPKRLWVVDASNHRFSGNPAEFQARLLEAIEWVKSRPAP